MKDLYKIAYTLSKIEDLLEGRRYKYGEAKKLLPWNKKLVAILKKKAPSVLKDPEFWYKSDVMRVTMRLSPESAASQLAAA